MKTASRLVTTRCCWHFPAAALSYGVLQELRDTRIDSAGQPVRLLDEVDIISSVSGGSFTAAYYGLYGDDIFRNYESDFLRKSVQSSLISNLLSPSYWFRAMFSGINRTDMAVNYYDRTIFHGATFADIPIDKRPFIEINATDLSTGAHFPFTQAYFDLLCTDLYAFPVARAVTASSGVPMAFPPVTLKNHADQCDIRHSYLSPLVNKKQLDSTREEELLPTGEYHDSDPVNAGRNYWAVEPNAAFTYLNMQNGREFSAMVGWTFNDENSAIDYDTGDELHIEWAAIQHLSKYAYVGLAGYAYQQTSGDSGDGATLGAFKGQALAIGPVLGATLPLGGKHDLVMNLRYYDELDTENRMQGDALFMTAAVKF